MNKQEAIERLDAIEKEQAELRKLIEQPELEQWLPDADYIMGLCDWAEVNYLINYAQDEKQLALVAWLHSFRNELYPDWEADWSDENQSKYLIRFVHEDKSLYIGTCSATETLGTVYMSRKCAEKFIKMYEAGQIDLSWYFGGDV
jgi:hypothetical protein